MCESRTLPVFSLPLLHRRGERESKSPACSIRAMPGFFVFLGGGGPTRNLARRSLHKGRSLHQSRSPHKGRVERTPVLGVRRLAGALAVFRRDSGVRLCTAPALSTSRPPARQRG